MDKLAKSDQPEIKTLRVKLLRDPNRLIGIIDLQVGEFTFRDFRLIRQCGGLVTDSIIWPYKEIQRSQSDKRKVVEIVSANSFRLKQAIEKVVQDALDEELQRQG